MRKSLLMTALLAAGCTTASGARSGSPAAKAETAVAKVLVSDQQENQIGDQVYAQLQQQGAKFVTDPTVTSYVKNIFDKLTAQAKKDRPDVDWRVYVIDDPKQVNAFSTPGGRLYVYSGLLKMVGSDAELAGVLGHEIGHEAARHVARSLVQQQGLQAVASMALGNNPNLAGQIATAIIGNGTLLAHSRSEETEADEYGARYASQAGYDPHALVSFFKKLEKQEGHTPAITKYISDHPLTADRIDHLQDYIASNHLSGSESSTQGLAQVQSALNGNVATSQNPQPGSAASGNQTQPAKPGQPAPANNKPSAPAPGSAPVHHR